MVNFESFAMNMRKKYTNNEDWYLYNLCVDKEAKGKKISSKLIKPLINYFKINKKIKKCVIWKLIGIEMFLFMNISDLK